MESFKDSLKDYVMSGHSLLSISTFEKQRAIEHIQKCAKEIDRKVIVWSASQGWHDTEGNMLSDISGSHPDEVIKSVANIPENSLVVLKEFCYYMHKDTYPEFDVILSWIETLKESLSHDGKTIIFIDATFQVPEQLQHDITNVDFPLPKDSDIENNIRFIVDGVETKDKGKLQLDNSLVPDIVRSCSGMTSQEINDRVALAIRKTKTIDSTSIKIIMKEKSNVIKASGLLEYKESPEGGLSNIGGYSALKNHVLLDKPCFSDEAKEYGIEPPKGILLAGIPGVGKTLISVAIASEFNLPLISLDIGCLMGSLVGESESNTRKAIKIIESVSPCVLQLDEIEKGLGGQSEGDGGSSKRVLGTILSWLNDRTCLCYVVATANNVTILPPEFLRSGRFDAIFGLDLPQKNERKEIFKIHISKRKRNPENFDIDALAEATNDFSGSDIESVIKLGLKIGFQQKKEVTNNDFLTAIDTTVPLAKLEPMKINQMKEWITKHSKLANPPEKDIQEIRKSRKVVA